MSERREWHGQVDKQGCLRTHHDGGIRMDWESVHVREVLPGDDDDKSDAYSRLRKRHAALVEAARAYVDWGPTTVPGASEEQANRHHADYLALRKALENE